LKWLHDQRIPLGVVVTLFGLKADDAIDSTRYDAEPVMLDFVNPFLAGGGLQGASRETRLIQTQHATQMA